MGIAEMNLVLLLGQLGLSWDFQRERLFPIGTLYDPFVMRALEGIVYSTYSGSRFVLAGTPSGISLSREGGAHQSLSTPGIGIETPGLTYAEPCYARELEWLLLDALARMQTPDGEALYLRLSTTPIDQAPFTAAAARAGEERLRAGRRRRRLPAPRARHASDDRVLHRRLRRDRAPRRSPQQTCSPTRKASRRPCSASPLPTASTATGKRRAAPLHGHATATSHLERLLLPTRKDLPVVTVIDGSATHSRSSAARSASAPSRSASTDSARPAANPSSTPTTASTRPRSPPRPSSRSNLRRFAVPSREPSGCGASPPDDHAPYSKGPRPVTAAGPSRLSSPSKLTCARLRECILVRLDGVAGRAYGERTGLSP